MPVYPDAFRPSDLPLAWHSRMERCALGFPPSFVPRRPGAGDARRGGDRPSSTDLKHALRHRPSLHPYCSLEMRATSRRTRQGRSGRQVRTSADLTPAGPSWLGPERRSGRIPGLRRRAAIASAAGARAVAGALRDRDRVGQKRVTCTACRTVGEHVNIYPVAGALGDVRHADLPVISGRHDHAGVGLPH